MKKKKSTAKVKAKAPRKPRQKAVLDPRIGKCVRYFDEGWRHGYLEDVKGQTAIVRPIGPAARNARIPVEDIELLSDWKGRR